MRKTPRDTLRLLGILALTLASSGCSSQDPPPAPTERYEAAPVVWRLAQASEKEAPQRVVQHLLALEALSGPLIEVAMREDGRTLCVRWGEEIFAFVKLVEPDFTTAARVKDLSEKDRASIEEAYTRFGEVAARCLSGGDKARGALTRVKDLVKPMLRAM